MLSFQARICLVCFSLMNQFRSLILNPVQKVNFLTRKTPLAHWSALDMLHIVMQSHTRYAASYHMQSYPFYSRQKIEDDSSLWLTQPEAQQYCAKHGSNMVSILSFEENSWVAARLFRQGFKHSIRSFCSVENLKKTS